MSDHLIFVAVLLAIMAVLTIAAWIESWWDARQDRRK